MKTAHVKIIIDDPGKRVPLHLRAVRKHLRDAHNALRDGLQQPSGRGRQAFQPKYYHAVDEAGHYAVMLTRNHAAETLPENRKWFTVGNQLQDAIEKLHPLFESADNPGDLKRFKSYIRRIMNFLRAMERMYKSSSRPTRSASKVSGSQVARHLEALAKKADLLAKAERDGRMSNMARGGARAALWRDHERAMTAARGNNEMSALLARMLQALQADSRFGRARLADWYEEVRDVARMLSKQVRRMKSASKGRFPSTGEFHRFMRQVSQANPARLNQRAVDYFVRMGNTFYRHYKVPSIRDGVQMLSDGWEAGDRRLMERGLQAIFNGVRSGSRLSGKSASRKAVNRAYQYARRG